MALWERSNAWPLAGRCPECGLDFRWSDVLSPRHDDLPWFYEHTPRFRLGFVRAWKTWRRALWPPTFWAQVKLTTRLNPLRLLLWPLVLVGGLQLLIFAANLSIVLFNGWIWQTTPEHVIAAIVSALVDPLAVVYYTGGGPGVGWGVALGFGVRGRPDVVNFAVTGPLAAAGLIPVMLLILGSTRATSSIRVGHVVRAGVLQGAAFAPIAIYYLVDRLSASAILWLSGAATGHENTLSFWFYAAAPILAIMLAAWLGFYWHVVITRGFKLDRPRLIWSLLMIAGVLISTIAGLFDHRLWRLLGWL